MRHSSPLSIPVRLILLFATLGWIASAIIINPKIISPKAKTVWPAGSIQTVTWSTQDIPEKDATGTIVLGYLSGKEGDTNEHLDYKNPLATGFKLTKGRQNIVIPNVEERKTYIIVLFGDSGNASPMFTITNPTPSKNARSRR
ncbi:hypothetical protein BGZ59_006610 [Podila verticillata]|nr:hypothetical protein BGZ59_006610 [Podila verticillata]KAI9242717.1 MAG: hypothetical protein BYD32DRAFT_431937 [Podila humilis]KFH65588.1 hypothetical protein MVEG_09064 [Podila verticillata NRRL 6337]